MGLARGGRHADRKGRDRRVEFRRASPRLRPRRRCPRAPRTVHGFGGRKVPVGPEGGQPGLEPRMEADRWQGVDGTPGL